MSDQIRVGVYGASGYAGQDLVQILSAHPEVEIVFAVSNSFTGAPVPGTDLRYINMSDANPADVDVVFLALPHKESAPVAKVATLAGKRVIDLSADLRFERAEDYEQWYHIPHPHPELLPVPYGLPEMHREAISGAMMVSVPGCYPTATLLGLYPLLRVQGIALDAPIIIDAKSGISGAGRTPTAKTHFVEAYGNLTPYSTGRQHRHVGEIEQEIARFMTTAEPVIFTPHLVPIDRGLMTSLYVTLNYNVSKDLLHSMYVNVYADEPLVKVLPLGSEAQIKPVANTNFCHISITPISDRYVHITSVIDNLRKGAASQAVQCFNLMYGFAETTALL